MTGERPSRGLIDTNVLILREWVNHAELPTEMAISAVTLAELSAGPHEVLSDQNHNRYEEREERSRRVNVLQRVEAEFDPIPFGAEAARAFGQVTALAAAIGRKPRPRFVDFMIAATAIAEELPLFTANPQDFIGLDSLLTVVPVARPRVPHER
jgi:predicted nucleic acid-binding protein